MNDSSLIPTPQTNYNLSEPSPKKENDKLVTGKALKSCAMFTGCSTALVFHPQFSLLVQGIKLYRKPPSGGYLSGLDNLFGLLMIGASPTSAVVKGGIGIPCILGGAVATLGMSTIYGTEYLFKRASKGIKQLAGYSVEENPREKWTGNFVQRLHLILKDQDERGVELFMGSPELLVAIGIISIAFLSRNEKGFSLKIGNNVVNLNDIAKLDEESKGFFKSVCEIKNTIQKLELSLDDDLAWDFLVNALIQCGEEIEKEKELSQSDILRLENLQSLSLCASELSEKITNDELFNKMWKESLEKQ